MKRLALVLLVTVSVFLAGCYVGVYSPPVSVGVRVPSNIRWELIPGTSIYYSSDPGVSVFYYDGRYYRVINGYWYVAPYWGAGWSIASSVPDTFLWIPPTHPAHRVVVYHPRYRYYHRPSRRSSHPGTYVVPKSPPSRGGGGRPAKGRKGTDERESPPPGGGGTWIRR